MVMRPKRTCAGQCGAVVTTGRCPRCARRTREAMRPKSADRGYDARWRRFRRQFLAKHPACEDCGLKANEVHHLAPISDRPDLRLTETNCVPLCKPCHTRREKTG